MTSPIAPIEVDTGGIAETALVDMGLDPAAAHQRDIWFLDDLTDGLCEALPLLQSSVVFAVEPGRERRCG